MKQVNNRYLADVHTHILPEMDDGAGFVEEAIKILKKEKEQGITDVVFTPHFRLEKESIDDFLSRREAAYEKLMAAVKEDASLSSLNFYKGAEVWYDPNIINQDVSKLCIENTSYLLLELLPSYPFNLENTLKNIALSGITPIIAHVERCSYLTENLKTMEELAEIGAVFQCNASSLFSRHHKKTVMKLVKKGMIHLFASDTHNVDMRPPNLADAYKKLKKSSDYFILNSLNVVNDALI